MAGVFTKCNGSMVSASIGEQVSVIGRVIKVPVNDTAGIVEAAVRRGFLRCCATCPSLRSLICFLLFLLLQRAACAQDGVQVHVVSSEDAEWSTCVLQKTRQRRVPTSAGVECGC